MRLFKQKLAWIAPIAVLLIIALFSINLVIQGDPTPKNLPVAIVSNETGHAGQIVHMLKEQMTGREGEPAALTFTQLQSEEEVRAAFDEKKYYAAVVIPENFNAALENLSVEGRAAEIQLLVNQGMNATGANLANSALGAMIDGMSQQVSEQWLARMEASNMTISANQVAAFADPIVTKVELVNAVGKASANGNAPLLMAMPAWVGALIGGMLLLLATQKMEILTRADRLRVIGEQIVLGAVMAVLSGFAVATLATWAGILLPSYLTVALFVAFSFFCFFMLVSATVSWIGKPAIMLFMIVMLLGMGTIMMPVEMLPTFFADYVRPWIPMRFAADGLREIFYFNQGFFTGTANTILTSIGLGSLAVYLLSVLKPVKQDRMIEKPE